MGLAQKRIVAEFQKSSYEKWKEQFDRVVGVKMKIDVKWDTLQNEEYQNRDDYFKWYEMVYFKPLMDAFKELCSDDMGKKAVREGVRKITIDGSDGSSYRHSKFEDGVLEINHKFHSNVDDIKGRTDGWRKLIEEKL